MKNALITAMLVVASLMIFGVSKYLGREAGSAAVATNAPPPVFDPSTARPVDAAGFAKCLLQRVPGSANGQVTTAAYRACIEAHPMGFKGDVRGAGGAGSFANADACILDRGAKTVDPQGANLIGAACRCLYSPSGTGFCAE